MKVYVSGPMTGIPEYNFPAFAAAATALRERGHEVVSPHELNPVDGAPMPWSWYLRRDIAALVECDAIATLPGWRTSKGATLEVHIAAALGMDLYVLGALLRDR